jgi:ATP-dependent DNA helicase RecQ
LTRKNEEAIQLAGLLIKKGLNARLIQSNEGFSLADMFELRCFWVLLNTYADTPLVSEDQWAEAKKALSELIQHSAKKEIVFIVVKQFDLANPVRKYKSDWSSFLAESCLDDFLNIDNETIFVSTIHKAKGKEFDNIFLMLNNYQPDTDDVKRALYVAFTRAKTNLSIHYNGTYLSSLSTEQFSYHKDENIYQKPGQLSLLLSHKDVQLSYFGFVQRRVKALASGDRLKIIADGLANSKGEMLLKYSQRFREELLRYENLGYVAHAAKVNFKVYWKGQEKEKEEVLIVLPELVLVKNSASAS